MHIEPGSIIGGKYRIERPLSRGGMGAVWVARHVDLDQQVAIKLMDAEMARHDDFRARFYREARIAARLESPHVVQVKDFGMAGDLPYLVMELLRGEDLGTRLKRLRRLDLLQVSRIASHAAKALRRAHDEGLVHRDLKPSNLFLARVDDEEILKVLDFGIVKVTGGAPTGEITRTGEVLGTAFYMSPEQVRGEKDLDRRSDLWSLAVILFQLITGRLPFTGDSFGAVLARILVEPPPRVADLVPGLPAGLDGFFAKALSRDRTARFQSAVELSTAFAYAAEIGPRDSFPSSSYPGPSPASIPAPATMPQGNGYGGDPPGGATPAGLSAQGTRGTLLAGVVPGAPPTEQKKASARLGWIALGILVTGVLLVGVVLLRGARAPEEREAQERQEGADARPAASTSPPAATTAPTPTVPAASPESTSVEAAASVAQPRDADLLMPRPAASQPSVKVEPSARPPRPALPVSPKASASTGEAPPEHGGDLRDPWADKK
ncbi:serine/threonine-protein kinase [Chondromyces apiculatus]|uniref:Serine/threonine protein kinase PksC n=1 Tax=Chondromyces apiculatus DSM 436 TaxID=1192034 RepID=A0A017T2D8_9BACT|nr:serine/threonine-protein kinase [Chondromyces apiculatus]EYF03429.1 serine/threonine protein kinase PksC [Chondromyces apiculatus DSM 436]